MLQNIRNNIQGTMAKVVIAIIIVPFALFGVESLFSGGGPTPVAEVDGTPITQRELANAISLQQRQMLAVMGDRVNPGMLDQDRLRAPVLNRLIRERVLLKRARDMGLVVSEQQLNETIASLPQFQENDRFSVERYQSVLRAQGLTPASFKEQLRRELLIQQLQRGISGSASTSQRELAELARILEQQRSFSYSVVDPEALGEVQVTEEQVRRYYEQHPDQFMRPEQVQVSYIELRLKDFITSVDEETLRAEFERVKDQLSVPSRHRAAHILIDIEDDVDAARERAEQLREQLRDGVDFAELAREYSDDRGSRAAGGDLGFSEGDVFPSAFEQALAELEVGEVSAPVRTDAGFHLIKLLDRDEASEPDFEEHRKRIAEELAQQSAEPELLRTVETLRDLSFNSDGLQQPARELDLSVERSGWIALEDSEAQESGVLDEPQVRAAIRSREVLEEGHNSEVIELAPDHFVVVNVADHRKAEQLPLEQVREQARSAARRQLLEERASERAQQLLSLLKEGVAFDRASREVGVEWQRAQGVKRSASDIPDGVLRLAFSRAMDDADKPVLVQSELSDGRVAVVALDSVKPGKLEEMDPGRRQALRRQLAENQGRAAFSAFVEHAQNAAEIERM